MFLKFLGINTEIDEMLRVRQDRVGAKMFWTLFLLSYALFFFQTLGLSEPLRVTWPSLMICIVGFIAYLILTLRSYIPIAPPVSKRILLFLVFGSAIALGVFVGVRNVFFLYAQNMQQYSFSVRAGMAAQIAGIIALEISALNALEVFVLYLLSKWQNKRIERHIEQENEE